MNRGSLGIEYHDVRSVKASMRPRFMNRGSHLAVLPLALLRSRFNEAPIHESGK